MRLCVDWLGSILIGRSRSLLVVLAVLVASSKSGSSAFGKRQPMIRRCSIPVRVPARRGLPLFTHALSSGLWKCERIPQKTCSASRDPKLCSITFHVIASCKLWALLCPVRPGRVFKILRQLGCILDKPTRRRKAAKAKGNNSMLLKRAQDRSVVA